MPIHPTASAGFTIGADDYEAARPSYAAEAIDWAFQVCEISTDAHVLDLAAGTGKLTRDLVTRAGLVEAVEPIEAMRQQFRRVSGVDAKDGIAESIPAQDHAFDAVFVGQAFHWFDPDTSIPEIHRVLLPNGSLTLMWNTRDKSDPIMRQLWELIDTHGKEIPKYRKRKQTDGLPPTKLFNEIARRKFPNPHPMTIQQMLTRVSSTSYIAVLPKSKKQSLLKEAEDLLVPHLDGDSALVAKYLTEVFCYRRMH